MMVKFKNRTTVFFFKISPFGSLRSRIRSRLDKFRLNTGRSKVKGTNNNNEGAYCSLSVYSIIQYLFRFGNLNQGLFDKLKKKINPLSSVLLLYHVNNNNT